MEPTASTSSISGTSSSILDRRDDRKDSDILAEAIQAIVGRINETYTRLQKVEKQLNLFPRFVQEHPASLKDYDTMLPTLLELVETCDKECKVDASNKSLCDQVIVLSNAFFAVRQVVHLAGTHQKPADINLFLCPIFNYIEEIGFIETRESNPSPSLSATATASQALKWINESSPPTFINGIKVKYLASKPDGSSPVIDILEKLITLLLEYVETHHKAGVEWKGNSDATHLSWDISGVQGANFAPGARTKHFGRDVWVCENLSKTLEHESNDQHCVLYNAGREGTLTVTGRVASLSLDNCQFSTVTVNEVGPVEITNCRGVNVVAPLATTINVERSVGCRILVSSAANITTYCTLDLIVETPKDDTEERVEVPIPSSFKIRVAKGGTITTSV